MAGEAELKVIISAFDRFSSQLDRMGASLSRIQGSSRATAGGVGALNRQLSGLSGSLFGISSLAGAVAIGIAAVGGATIYATKSAIDFESSFAGIKKTVDATDEEFKQLEGDIRSMAVRLGQNVNTLNAIGETAGQLGITGVKNIAAFVETVARIPDVTNLSAEEAATAFGKIAGVTGFPIKNIETLAAVLVDLGNKGKSTEADILEFANRIAGAGTIAGLTVPEIFAIGSAFSDVGVEAEAGGTAIQKVLLDMQKSVVTGNENLAIFAGTMGLTNEQFAELFRQNPAEAFTRFVETLSAAGERAQLVLEALGFTDVRLARSFLSAAVAGGDLRRQLDTANIAAEEGTAALTEYEKRMRTAAKQIDQAKASMRDAAIEAGQNFLPAVVLLANGVEALGNGLKFAIQNIDLTVAALLAIATVITGTGGLAALVLFLAFRWQQVFSQMPGPVQNAAILVAGAFDAMVNAIIDALNKAVSAINGFVGGANKILGKLGIPEIPGIPQIGITSNVAGTLQQAQYFSNVFDTLSGEFQKLIGLAKGSGGGVGGGVGVFDESALPAAASGAAAAADAAEELLTVAKALEDGIIDLDEAMELGLHGTAVAVLELTNDLHTFASEAFRTEVEMQKLYIIFSDTNRILGEGTKLFAESELDFARAAFESRTQLAALDIMLGRQGLAGQAGVFRNALLNLGEGFRTATETVAQFLHRLASSALSAAQSAFDDLFSRPTRQQAEVNLQLAELRRQRILLLQGGQTEEDARVKAIDDEIERIEQINELRRVEHEILKAQADLADKTLLTDQALLQQANLYLTAISEQSRLVLSLNAALFYEGLARLAAIGALNDFTASLRGATGGLGGGQRALGPGQAGLSIAVHVQAPSARQDIIRTVSEELNRQLDRAALGASSLSTGAI